MRMIFWRFLRAVRQSKVRTDVRCLLAALLLTATAPARTQTLFDEPVLLTATLSPDGQRVAMIVNTETGQSIDRFELATSSLETVFTTNEVDTEEVQVTGLSWVDSETIVFSVVQKTDGIGKLSDTKVISHIFVKKVVGADQPLRFIQSAGKLVDPLPQTADRILYAVSGRKSFVYSLDTTKLSAWGTVLAKTAAPDGGQLSRANRVAEVEGLALKWVTDANNELSGVMTVAPDEGVVFRVPGTAADEWVDQRAWPLEDTSRKSRKRKRADEDNDDEDEDLIFVPLASIPDSDDFVVVSSFEDEEAVYRYNYESGAKTLIYNPPGNEVIGLRTSYDGSKLLEVSYFEGGEVRHHYFDDVYLNVQQVLKSQLAGRSLRILGADIAAQRYLVRAASTTRAGEYFVFDLADNRLSPLGAEMPWLADSAEIETTVGSVISEGLPIEYFLTVPNGVGPFPVVVYPHGGPWAVRDSRGFDPLVQHLAQHGMAVLQVNYRGSGGYGEAFIEAGMGEYGGLALTDIERSLAAVLQRSDMDSQRVCAMGLSYGGYAAFMLAITSPATYRCVVSLAAPTDLGLFVDSYADEFSEQLLSMITGDPDRGDSAYEKLRELSPLYRAGEIAVPVLVAQGADDRRVDLEHGLRMHMRLQQLNKEHTWLLYPEQGHNFSSAKDLESFADSALTFLQQHLGLASGI
jgi:dipeptidyl aminopeptidase/acylaminoacyl peptidase